ncbi:unnamed protein product [Heligmosomoides polygyrus]|uniref:Uncharacterized protein n=1 Tax=Heligmosomoides polygyrus TaxID=6339 RepID=A0A183GPD0_HELPZ|nr:unnamed protein product [Heligmosomoides polygyrus]
MSANPRVVSHLLTPKCGSSLDAVPSRDEMKLAERMAIILQDFELRQLEIDKVEKLEVVEEEDQEFQPKEDCAAGVTTPLISEGTTTFSGGQIVSKRFGYTRIVILYKFENWGKWTGSRRRVVGYTALRKGRGEGCAEDKMSGSLPSHGGIAF